MLRETAHASGKTLRCYVFATQHRTQSDLAEGVAAALSSVARPITAVQVKIAHQAWVVEFDELSRGGYVPPRRRPMTGTDWTSRIRAGYVPA